MHSIRTLGLRYNELFPAGRVLPKFLKWIEDTVDGCVDCKSSFIDNFIQMTQI